MSTDGWKQGLLHLQHNLREYARTFEEPPAACHAFFSPEPIHQHDSVSKASDFHELYNLRYFHFSDREPSSYKVLRQDQKTVEALYMFLSDDQCNKTALRKYQRIASELLDIIFGSEEQARKLLSLKPTRNRLPTSSLWTLVLFRLATQRIDGFGLSPLDARNDEDVFQTLWPVSQSFFTRQCESISFGDLHVNEHLLLPNLYEGTVWVLSEVNGNFHVSSRAC